MVVALDQSGLVPCRRVPRRAALRLIALLGALPYSRRHDPSGTYAQRGKNDVERKRGKNDVERKRGNEPSNAAKLETSSKPKISDNSRNRRKAKNSHDTSNKRRNAKKSKNDAKHKNDNDRGTGTVEPVDPLVPVDPIDPVDPAKEPIALGAYIFNGPGDPTEIDRFANDMGRSPAIIMWYEQWGGWDQGKLRLRELGDVLSRGAAPMITWDPWDPYAGPDQPSYRLANIALGHFDTYVDSWATTLASVGQKVYLRFGHEMNGNWYPWCAGCNGNAAADYVAAWRHIHARFIAAGATNVRWVWSPNIEFGGSTAMAELYPGDAYVDWVALDGYNWGTSQTGKEWLHFKDIFLPSYQRLLSLTSKPMMIAETASTELGGDKAAWIRQALLEELPTAFPRVKALIWFHEKKETDWRISSSPTALAAFQEAASSPYLQGRLG